MSRSGSGSWLGALALFALTLVLAAGCGGSDDSAGSSGSGETVSSGETTSTSESASLDGSSSAWLEGVDEYADELLGPKGTFEDFPTSSPTRPDPGRKIAIISCGDEVGACAFETEEAARAAKRLGYTTTHFDAKSDPASANTAIRNALAEGVDGIHTYAVDCENIKASLEEAKEAGVPVVAAESRDCNETSPGAESLYTYVIHYAKNKSFPEYQEENGRASASYAISKYEGKSNALSLVDDAPYIKAQEKGWVDTYAECEECKLKVVPFPLSAYGTRLQGIAESELLQNPEANTFLPSFEAAALETYPAVVASGRGEEMVTFVGEGNVGGLDLIREGANAFAFNWPVRQAGWGAMDAFGRIFLGQKPVHMGQGVQLIDAEHNLSKSGPAEPPVDYVELYEKLWGLK